VAKPSVDLLRGVQLFAELDDRFLESLASEFMARTYAAGESGRTLIVIESGSVTVTVHGEEVARLGAGDAFGEMSLIDRSARSATVKADTEVRGYQLPVWSFRPLVESHPEVAWSLLEALAQRVRAIQGGRSQSES
jgi:CRP/FNR family transcriptional regulator, cyclic AMP receptor protein